MFSSSWYNTLYCNINRTGDIAFFLSVHSSSFSETLALPQLTRFIFVLSGKEVGALCSSVPLMILLFFLMKTANNVFVFFHLQQNHNGSWQAIVPSWHGAAAHCADRLLMWDYIELCVPAGTFRGQEDFEIQWMWLQFFCQNWIRAQAAYFYLNLMLSRVQRQLLHLQQIVRKGKKKRKKAECTPLIVSEAVWVDGLCVIHKLSCLRGNIREITRRTGAVL